MSSKIADFLTGTAAWRVSAVTSLAFALGTGAAFIAADLIVARGIRERSDAWLRGETELLAELVATTPPGDVSARLVKEVAELARHEVLPAIDASGLTEQPVFFLVTYPDGRPDLWVGPKERDVFVEAIRRKTFDPGVPRSILASAWTHSFRVNVHRSVNGPTIYLGFLDQSALSLQREMTITFAELWVGMLIFGFVISWVGARRILHRVERITETAGQIGASDIQKRVPEEKGHDEISRLAETFNRMLDRIETSMDQIRAFGDSVAHDLRSPVTSIRGNLEMALTRGEAEELREAAALAVERIDRLLDVLNTSLDVAEAEAGALRVSKQRVDLQEIVAEMVDLYRPSAEERGVVIETDARARAFAWVDPVLVRRALANLLDNAVQHLAPGRRVRVSAETSAEHLTLSVTDDGPGFPAEVRDHPFRRFTKGPASKGFGIGLSLVRAAALAHGGEAKILDVPGGGACVSLSFPAAPNRSVA
jgi:signal transduction histidine kinase